jgi:hypothetical protein
MKQKNRGSPPSHRRIAEANFELLKRIDGGMSVEDGQATCWACGASDRVPSYFRALADMDEATSLRYQNEDYRKESDLGWLERAHVVSVAAGGGTEPSNFFLLCGLCHREQPDGSSREAQEAWLISHESQIERGYRLSTPLVQWVLRSVPDAQCSDIQRAFDIVKADVEAKTIDSGLGSNSPASEASSFLWNVAERIVRELKTRENQ